jgi:hypothetical protein
MLRKGSSGRSERRWRGRSETVSKGNRVCGKEGTMVWKEDKTGRPQNKIKQEDKTTGQRQVRKQGNTRTLDRAGPDPYKLCFETAALRPEETGSLSPSPQKDVAGQYHYRLINIEIIYSLNQHNHRFCDLYN